VAGCRFVDDFFVAEVARVRLAIARLFFAVDFFAAVDLVVAVDFVAVAR
jgi:hypothetical protein